MPRLTPPEPTCVFASSRFPEPMRWLIPLPRIHENVCPPIALPSPSARPCPAATDGDRGPDADAPPLICGETRDDWTRACAAACSATAALNDTATTSVMVGANEANEERC